MSTSSVADEDFANRNNSFFVYNPNRLSGEGFPMMMSPCNQSFLPFTKSSWSNFSDTASQKIPQNGLIGSLIRKEGHIYSWLPRMTFFILEEGLLYFTSWDMTFKVWIIGNSKCIESVKAHDDAVNSMVASVDGMVYTDSADRMVKV
ncbi:unnamed protein product [Fraxinus pennsylvanica]|uniref:Uncharacterized protein n=1 Tax=Fraxinus pennsylvanica TaxID=56036 RepID=A0AAD1YR57_9LAMI|nr:unnamed protein product [Fraxinus pennsylvanica]